MGVTIRSTKRLPSNLEQGARCYPSRWNNTRTNGMNGTLDHNANWEHPVGKWDLRFALQQFGVGSVQAVIAMHMNLKGGADGFLFEDPSDHRAPFLISDDRQLLGVGDGTTTQFQAIVSYGDEAEDYVRTVRRVEADSLRVWVNGVELAGADFSVAATTGLITLATAPLAAQSVEAYFTFYKAVVFERDDLPAEIRLLLDGNPGASVGSLPAINLIEVLED